jgi:ADP-heptose:LPS heptosyltransferase
MEIAIRRAFISSLQLRSRSKKNKIHSSFPLDLPEKPVILFLRQDRLGDAIISTPVLAEMYKKYPDGRFIVLLGENNAGIADLLPIPCEVVIYRKKLFSDLAMLRKLRKRKIDILIDMMDNPSSTSSILTAIISARFSIGIEKENASSYNVLVPLIDREKFHIARRITELLRPFGIDPEKIHYAPQLKNILTEQRKGRAGLVISAGTVSRYARNEVNAEIALGLLSQDFASEVLVLFDPKDTARAHELIHLATDPRIILSQPSSSFATYAKQLASCEFIVTPDTSSIHLCSAFGIPVVGIYAPLPPKLHYWTPIGVPYEMIVQPPSLESLESETVLNKVASLMQKIKTQFSEEVLTA